MPSSDDNELKSKLRDLYKKGQLSGNVSAMPGDAKDTIREYNEGLAAEAIISNLLLTNLDKINNSSDFNCLVEDCDAQGVSEEVLLKKATIVSHMMKKIDRVLTSSNRSDAEKRRPAINILFDANDKADSMSLKLALVDVCKKQFSNSGIYFNGKFFDNDKKSTILSVILNTRRTERLENGLLKLKSRWDDGLTMYIDPEYILKDVREVCKTEIDIDGNKVRDEIVRTQFVEVKLYDNNMQHVGVIDLEENFVKEMEFLAGKQKFYWKHKAYYMDKNGKFFGPDFRPVDISMDAQKIAGMFVLDSKPFFIAQDGSVFDEDGNRAKINLDSVVENKNIKNINLEEGVIMPKNNNNNLVNGSEEPNKKVAHPYLALINNLLDTKKSLLDKSATSDEMVDTLKADVVKMFALTETNPLLHLKKEGIELLKQFEYAFYEGLPREVHDELDAYVVEAECAEKMDAFKNQLRDSENLSISKLDDLNTGLGIFESELVERKEDGHGYSAAKCKIFDKYLKEAEELSKKIEAKFKEIKEKQRQLEENEAVSLMNEREDAPTALVSTDTNVGIIPKRDADVKTNLFMVVVMWVINRILSLFGIKRPNHMLAFAPVENGTHEIEEIENEESKDKQEGEKAENEEQNTEYETEHEVISEISESDNGKDSVINEPFIITNKEQNLSKKPEPPAGSSVNLNSVYSDQKNSSMKEVSAKTYGSYDIDKKYIKVDNKGLNGSSNLHRIKAVAQDITKSNAEVIVNSGCTGSGSGVDKQIYSTFCIEGGECNLGPEQVELREAYSKIKGVSEQTKFVLMTNPTYNSSREERINLYTRIFDVVCKLPAEDVSDVSIVLSYNGAFGTPLEEAVGYIFDAIEQFPERLGIEFKLCLWGEIKTLTGVVTAEQAVKMVNKIRDERLARISVIDENKSKNENDNLSKNVFETKNKSHGKSEKIELKVDKYGRIKNNDLEPNVNNENKNDEVKAEQQIEFENVNKNDQKPSNELEEKPIVNNDNKNAEVQVKPESLDSDLKSTENKNQEPKISSENPVNNNHENYYKVKIAGGSLYKSKSYDNNEVQNFDNKNTENNQNDEAENYYEFKIMGDSSYKADEEKKPVNNYNDEVENQNSSVQNQNFDNVQNENSENDQDRYNNAQVNNNEEKLYEIKSVLDVVYTPVTKVEQIENNVNYREESVNNDNNVENHSYDNDNMNDNNNDNDENYNNNDDNENNSYNNEPYNNELEVNNSDNMNNSSFINVNSANFSDVVSDEFYNQIQDNENEENGDCNLFTNDNLNPIYDQNLDNNYAENNENENEFNLFGNNNNMNQEAPVLNRSDAEQSEDPYTITSVIGAYYDRGVALDQNAAFNRLSENDKKIVLKTLGLDEQPLQNQASYNQNSEVSAQEEAELEQALRNSLQDVQNHNPVLFQSQGAEVSAQEEAELEQALRNSLQDMQNHNPVLFQSQGAADLAQSEEVEKLDMALSDINKKGVNSGYKASQLNANDIIKAAKDKGVFDTYVKTFYFFDKYGKILERLPKNVEESTRKGVIQTFCDGKLLTTDVEKIGKLGFNLEDSNSRKEYIEFLRSQIEDVDNMKSNLCKTPAEKEICDVCINTIKGKIMGINANAILIERNQNGVNAPKTGVSNNPFGVKLKPVPVGSKNGVPKSEYSPKEQKEKR